MRSKFKLILLLSSLFFSACDYPQQETQRNFWLNPLASHPTALNELKERWFYCERCLNDPQCESANVQQCQNITLADRPEALAAAVTNANTVAIQFLVEIARKRLDFITLLSGCCARVKKSQHPTEALYLCP